MDLIDRLTSARAMRGWSWALLAANIMIIVTGGFVRLTGSGLGCPSWPRCTPDSYTPTPAMGVHGIIEFGNRMIAIALSVVALVTFLVALFQRRPDGRRRGDLIGLSLALGLGVPFQAVIGGITVLVRLNPSWVSPHLLLSLVLVAGSVILVHRTYGRRPLPVPNGGGWLPVVVIVLLGVALVLGTVVTGSGPHAGDADAVRNGLDAEVVSHLHAAAVYATTFFTLVAMVWLRSPAALLLLAIEVGQGLVGFLQFYNGLPIGLVALHLLGASLATAAATNLLLRHRIRSTA